MKSDLIDIDAIIKHETDKAYLLDFGGSKPEWVPKSRVQNNGDGTFAMPEKLAIEKGMV